MPGRKARHIAENWKPVNFSAREAKFNHMQTLWYGEVKTIWQTGVDPMDNPEYERNWLRSIHSYDNE